MNELRALAAQALKCQSASEKQMWILAAQKFEDIDAQRLFPLVVGRPESPKLVAPRNVPSRNPSDPIGRGMLLHALAHIEFNAINLALDLVVNYANMPLSFYRDWLSVAYEEALHHQLLQQRLISYGIDYGHYPAHDGLWQMAEKTRGDLMARLGLVPRLLEARGLDVSPAIRDKLIAAGDPESAEVLQRILDDEIGHVAIGNRWFAWVCEQTGESPIAAFEVALNRYQVAGPRSPFNFDARRKAGFTQAELDWLTQIEHNQGTTKTSRT